MRAGSTPRGCTSRKVYPIRQPGVCLLPYSIPLFISLGSVSGPPPFLQVRPSVDSVNSL